MSPRADDVRTDQLPVVPRTDRLPAVPAPRTPPVGTGSRRRASAPPLTTDERKLAEVLERFTRAADGSITVRDQRLARALAITVRDVAPLTSRLRAAADTYASHPAHQLPCASALPCTPQRVCDAHLAPLQDWWDARDLAVRALWTLAVSVPLPTRP